MNLQYILMRSHIFKNRSNKKATIKYVFRFQRSGLISLKNQRFELVYLRFFKKLLRRIHMKKKMFFHRRKFWLYLHPNKQLTAKSVNSRMGAGVGKFIRLAVLLKQYQTFVEFYKYSLVFLKTFKRQLRFRVKLIYSIKHNV